MTTFLPNLVWKFKSLVYDLATVTLDQVDHARGQLKALIGEQIVLDPSSDGAGRFFTAKLSGDYAGLVRLVSGPILNFTTVDQ